MRKLVLYIFSLIIIALPLPCQAQQTELLGMIVPAEVMEAPALPETTITQNKDITVSRSIGGFSYTKLLNTAMSLLGCKYTYGGSGPDEFDCSGFTRYVYGTAGYDLPHSAAEQADYGIAVDKQDLQPGDLVFFSYYNGPGINHVGIYTGDNKFIHASSSEKSNKQVTISGLDSPYYESNYKGARRLLR